jgi:hypothetical protein
MKGGKPTWVARERNQKGKHALRVPRQEVLYLNYEKEISITKRKGG